MDDALGLAGGAAGIDQDADVVGRGLGLEPGRLEGGGGGKDVLAMRKGTEAVECPQAGQPGLECGGALGEGVGIDEQRGDARILQQIGVVVFRGQRVHPGDAQPHHVGRRGGQEGFRAVGRERGDGVALAQATCLQRLDESAEERAEGPIGDSLIVEDESIPVAAALDRPHQQFAHRATIVEPCRHSFSSACLRHSAAALRPALAQFI